jgi:hypothetical protein
MLRPARRLLIFASVVTLALNVAEPLVAGQPGKAAFDAVGPLLLIGWSEVGPGLLQAINSANLTVSGDRAQETLQFAASANDGGSREMSQPEEEGSNGRTYVRSRVRVHRRCCWRGLGRRTRLIG